MMLGDKNQRESAVCENLMTVMGTQSTRQSWDLPAPPISLSIRRVIHCQKYIQVVIYTVKHVYSPCQCENSNLKISIENRYLGTPVPKEFRI